MFLGLCLSASAASAAPDAPRAEYFTGFEVSDNYASGYVGGGYAFGKAGLYEQGFRLRAVGAFGRYHYEGTLPADGAYLPTIFDGQDASLAATDRGLRAVCIREVQQSLAQSSKLLVEDKIEALGVGSQFRVLTDRIVTPGDGLVLFKGMNDFNANSIKSLEAFDIAWIEEAQDLSHRSLALLRPTIRSDGSEIWASWNPRRKSDAIDEFLRASKPENATVVKANWRDNPWFPSVLEEERKLDLRSYPERYDHIWEGDYARAHEGAYFAQALNEARAQGRIGRVTADPLLPLRAFWDIGGSSDRADATAIWIAQFIKREIRLLDYIEGQGQVLGYYTNELRARGYQRAICVLPHDGVNENNVTGKRFADHLRDAEFEVPEPIKNQGRGAAMMRIEAVRRILPMCWFNEATTEAGREALGYYHERKDQQREVGLGPDHDWSSHGCDAFGLMAVAYEEPGRSSRFNRKLEYRPIGIV